jgi:prepilin-type N-terminal cleavage/methylation domain-containing protein
MKVRSAHYRSPASGFTMVEIAISLAIIGVALVAIIGVLPLGMNVQKANREQTIINQDATVFIEAIRNGARGLDNLTNYVYAITNYQGRYSSGSTHPTFNVYGYVNSAPSYLTNGANIIGLLSMPEFTDNNGNPLPVPPPYLENYYDGDYYSNHIVAYVHSINGPAVEKPPQNNNLLVNDSFGYRLYCVNAPLPVATNDFITPYNQQLTANMRELRLTFLWPQQPNGSLGSGRQTFRALVAGQISRIIQNNITNYFYQSQSFTNIYSQ